MQISQIRNKKRSKSKHPGNPGNDQDYFENLYSNQLENLEEMDKFLDTNDHPKLNQEDIKHLNRSVTHNEIEAAIKDISYSPPLYQLSYRRDTEAAIKNLPKK
jgi:hypothetical protein